MDTTDDDIIRNENGNNITFSQHCKNNATNIINEGLQSNTMEKNIKIADTVDKRSETKIHAVEQMKDCQNLDLNDDKSHPENGDNNKVVHDGINNVDNIEGTSNNHKHDNKKKFKLSNGSENARNDGSACGAEPVEKKYKRSSNNSNNSLLGDGHVDSLNQSNDNEGAVKQVNERSNSETKENSALNLSGESSTKDEPSCSNDMVLFKHTSKLKKRHYRTCSDNSDEADDESGKKARETMSCEETRDELNAIQNSQSDSNRRLSFNHISESESSDGLSVPPSIKDDDSNDWTTDSDNDELEGKTVQVMKKPKPKPNFFIIPELSKREIGCNRLLHRNFYGSLHVVQRLELMYKMEEHVGCVNAINFNEDGSLLASGSDDLEVVVWDWAVGRKRSIYETGHTLNIFEVKWLFSNYKNLIATCARDGHIRLLDLEANVHRKLASHREEARRLAVHPDHPYRILSVGDDGKVLTIDIREEQPVRLLKVQEDGRHTSLYTIHINPRNSNEFCTGGRSQTVKIFDKRKASEPVKKLTPQNLNLESKPYVTCAQYNYNGTEIVASYNDDDIYLFDTATSSSAVDYAHKFEGHRNSNTVKSVNFFGPRSEFIVSGSDCGNIFIWDKNTEAIVQWMPGDEQGVVNRLEPHPYIPILATSGLDSDIKIWVPSCERDPSMTDLEKCIKNNFKYRNDRMSHIPDLFNARILTVLRNINRFRTMRINMPRFNRRQSQNSTYQIELESSSDSRSMTSDSPSDGDDSDVNQCSTS